jgi:uncharacterized membrane protein YfcA
MTGVLLLIIVAFFTSTLTAVVGLGGGLLLLAVMAMILPPIAVIPVHGVVQLCSNLTRAWFGRRELVISLLIPFIFGVVLGGICGLPVLQSFPATALPLPLGLFILLLTWLPHGPVQLKLPGKFFTLGLVNGFITLFVGATGPLNMPVLLRHGLTGNQAVATMAALMTTVHLVKIAIFGLIGFAFAAYLPLIAGMVLSVTAGSWFGTRIRHRTREDLLRWTIKLLLTILALRMIWIALVPGDF